MLFFSDSKVLIIILLFHQNTIWFWLENIQFHSSSKFVSQIITSDLKHIEVVEQDCNKPVTPLLIHWSYPRLALSHWYGPDMAEDLGPSSWRLTNHTRGGPRNTTYCIDQCSGTPFNINKTSYPKISWRLEVASMVISIVASLLKFDRHISSTAACQISEQLYKFWIQISQLWDFARSYIKTSYRILKQGPILLHRASKIMSS